MLSGIALVRTLSAVGNSCMAAGAVPALRMTNSLFNLRGQSELTAGLSTLSMDHRVVSHAACSSSIPDLHTAVTKLPTQLLNSHRYIYGTNTSGYREFSTEDAKSGAANNADKAEEAGSSDESPEDAAATMTVGEHKAVLEEKEKLIVELQEKAQTNADKLLRALAEMENLRQRTSRELDNTQKYAVQKFAKSVLEVADTLERAYESVPEPVKQGQAADLTLERATTLLKGVVDGVQMTSNVLLQVLKQHGIEQYNPVNEKFDPNLHNALFEVPDPTKEAGTIAVVTKRGYKMFDRVVRPAEVGVVRAAE